jgi:hypothetical protein
MKTEREKKLELALKRIEKWFGEFPYPTYGTDWGSNGERDFMRQIAREALEEDFAESLQQTDSEEYHGQWK